MPGMRRRRGGVVRTVGRTAVVAGTASAVAGGVHNRQSKKYQAQADQQQQDAAQQQQAAYDQGQADSAAQAPPADAASAGNEDVYAQLERLAKLRDDGVLTEEEFAAQKAKLLA